MEIRNVIHFKEYLLYFPHEVLLKHSMGIMHKALGR
jgi:hypothetical protein